MQTVKICSQSNGRLFPSVPCRQWLRFSRAAADLLYMLVASGNWILD